MNIKNLTIAGLTAAMICILAPISVPSGPIHISLATFAIYLSAAITGWKNALISVFIYIFLGAAGLPVFAGFTGGFQKIIGVSGGFIIGYLPCVLACSLLIDKFEKHKFIYPLSMITGTVFCYLSGTFWFMYLTRSSFTAAAICIVPFIIGDIIKIIAASLISIKIRPLVKKYVMK